MNNFHYLEKQFQRMGAKVELRTEVPRRRWGPTSGFSIDIEETRHGEKFLIQVRKNLIPEYEFQVVDLKPKDRHLVLMARENGNKEKFLCGHDERHWFVAGVNQSVRDVEDAMTSLKPMEAARSQQRRRVKHKDRHKRHNEGFLRQGEWFFIPRPNFVPKMKFAVLKNEPISRGGGSKPHMIGELYREGGETVYVCRQYPQGLTEDQHKRLLQRNAKAKHFSWQTMRRNPKVYARGTVKHLDHKTIRLPHWHEVIMNKEEFRHTIYFLD
ncbi:MAG: hypothetical protein AAFQ83_14015 [Bacteroidota bacterium]